MESPAVHVHSFVVSNVHRSSSSSASPGTSVEASILSVRELLSAAFEPLPARHDGLPPPRKRFRESYMSSQGTCYQLGLPKELLPSRTPNEDARCARNSSCSSEETSSLPPFDHFRIPPCLSPPPPIPQPAAPRPHSTVLKSILPPMTNLPVPKRSRTLSDDKLNRTTAAQQQPQQKRGGKLRKNNTAVSAQRAKKTRFAELSFDVGPVTLREPSASSPGNGTETTRTSPKKVASGRLPTLILPPEENLSSGAIQRCIPPPYRLSDRGRNQPGKLKHVAYILHSFVGDPVQAVPSSTTTTDSERGMHYNASHYPRTVASLVPGQRGFWIIPISGPVPFSPPASDPQWPSTLINTADRDQDERGGGRRRRQGLVWTDSRLRCLWKILTRMHELGTFGRLNTFCAVKGSEGAMEGWGDCIKIETDASMALWVRAVLQAVRTSKKEGEDTEYFLDQVTLVWCDDSMKAVLAA